jgi:mannose-6-phosphate isomerase-like protein (cupin superfamily)
METITEAITETIKVAAVAEGPPEAWRSHVLGEAGGACIKVLRMDGTGLPKESHGAAEALYVVDGRLELDVDGDRMTLRTGELRIVPPLTPHTVRPGSHGVLLIVEQAFPEAAGTGSGGVGGGGAR